MGKDWYDLENELTNSIHIMGVTKIYQDMELDGAYTGSWHFSTKLYPDHAFILPKFALGHNLFRAKFMDLNSENY